MSSNLQVYFSRNQIMFSALRSHPELMYLTHRGTMQTKSSLSSREIYDSNIRFREVVEKKLENLPVNVQEFLNGFEQSGRISFKVTREHPLTKQRLIETTYTINEAIRNMDTVTKNLN